MSHRETCCSHNKQQREKQQDLPSPCTALSPLHPDWSQTEPQWRCWWRSLADHSTSLWALQPGVQDRCSPPQSSGPGRCSACSETKQQKLKTALMCVICKCDTFSDQFNEMDQAVIEGSDGGALMGILVQTFFAEHLGSRKVQLVTVTFVRGCSPENRTNRKRYSV